MPLKCEHWKEDIWDNSNEDPGDWPDNGDDIAQGVFPVIKHEVSLGDGWVTCLGCI